MSRRIALVVGVSQYHGFSCLPNASNDAERMAQVLKSVAKFDDVCILIDPDALKLAEASEYLFADKGVEDLVLLYFSGHGIKDERGQLYLAVGKTHKHANGELVRATAVSCRHIHDIMSASRSRRQVIILDCCFSGAFAEGSQPKDGGQIDLRAQLGGEGRVILTSSSSTQYSFDTSDMGLSTYTQYLVQGIASGEADLNHDGLITADELHEYAKVRVQSKQSAMSPQILPSRQGYSIVISTAQKVEPRHAYAVKVRQIATISGTISRAGEQILALHRVQLGLAPDEARILEEAELGPRRVRNESCALLRKAVYEARVRSRHMITDQPLLNELRVALSLSEADLNEMLVEPLSAQRKQVVGWRYWPVRIGLGIVLVAAAAAIVLFGNVMPGKDASDQWRADATSLVTSETPAPARTELPAAPALSTNEVVPPPDPISPVASKPARRPQPVDLPEESDSLNLPKLGLKASAPPGTAVGDAIGGGLGHMVQGPGLVATVEIASKSRPQSILVAKQEADIYTPNNYKETKLADGWAITFDNEGGMGKNYFLQAHRTIGGKSIWCETTASTPTQQKNALNFCKSLQK